MKTIYKTFGAAKEYCEYALDIFDGCPHGCTYCFNKLKAEKKNNKFEYCGIRKGLSDETLHYLREHKEVWGKTIFLGFSSDPLPRWYLTYDIYLDILEIIEVLREFDCKIMFCTKNGLNNTMEDNLIKGIIKESNYVGVTLTCGEDIAMKYEPNAADPYSRIKLLEYAHEVGKETWISFEPVLEQEYIINLLKHGNLDFVDKFKFGKLNHITPRELSNGELHDVNWKNYANRVIAICENKGYNYMIKEALLREM